ncbi:MAG: protein-disulfide reductase DsbD [Pseudomonadales bacterium]
MTKLQNGRARALAVKLLRAAAIVPPAAFMSAAAIFVSALMFAAAPAHAADGSALSKWLEEEEDTFLPVDEAFRLTTELGSDGAVLARWEMPDGYYLYRHRFEFKTRPLEGEGASDVVLGEAEIPPGKRKVDEYFGEVEVYYHGAQARIPVVAGAGMVEVGIGYQGCADAGLCYPPETKWLAFNLSAADAGSAAPPRVMGTAPSGSATGLPATGVPATGVPATEEQALASLLGSGSLLTALALFFVGGIALAFTPCVLPMVPILSSIIVGESEQITRGRAFSLSLAYVLGMAFTYAVVGTLVGLFGASLNLQAALQSPPVLVFFAAVFVLLSLSMFGFYELQLPQSWQNSLNSLGNRVGGGKHVSVLVMGSLSALVVSPCVSAPLAGALIYLSTTGDALLGGGALLALGLGMGVPLLIIGSSGGHLLPRAGAWMNGVKAVFGVGLLAVAVWLLERVVPPALTLALWAALAIGSGVFLGALDFSPRQGWQQLWKATGAFGFIYGVLLLIGAASGAEDPLKPLAGLTIASAGSAESAAQQEAEWHEVANLDSLRVELARAEDAGQMALLDLYADWCISCKVMERSVFPLPEVDSRLRQFRLLRADVTENDAEDKALMNEFGLFGPPSLVFFAPDGRELADVRVQGEIGAQRLARHLQAVLDRQHGVLASR